MAYVRCIHVARYPLRFFGLSRFFCSNSLSIFRKSCFIPDTSFRVGIRCNGDFGLRGAPMTLPEVKALYSTDDTCRELLEGLRLPQGVTCQRCKDRLISRLTKYARYECIGCQ